MCRRQKLEFTFFGNTANSRNIKRKNFPNFQQKKPSRSHVVSGRGKRTAKKSPSHKWIRRLTAVSAACILALSAVSAGAITAINTLGRNIQSIDTSELDNSSDRPTAPIQTDTSATNLLIMGSDSRTGKGNGGYGYVPGERSDTTLLVHIYEGRKSAIVVSIPRDSLVTIPKCKTPSGGSVGPWTTKFNAAFAFGGPICTIKTIEKLSGIRINNFVVVDFNAFKTVVDSLGGVEVCFTTPVYDPIVAGVGGSGLNLPAGFSTLNGENALKFVRARESLGDGSDIGRITRQQEFVSSMIRSVEAKGLLRNPALLYGTASTVTKSLTTSTEFANVRNLERFGLSLTGLSPKNIKLVATPFEYIKGGNVGWTSETKKLWAAIRADKPWPPVSPSPSPSVSASRKPSPSPSVSTDLITPPESITVDVLNATGKTGFAAKVATQLRAQGFQIGSVATAPAKIAKTKVRYSKDYFQSARTLAYSARTSLLTEDDVLGKRIQLVIGPDWRNARKVVLAVTDANNGGINAGTKTCSAGNNRTK